MVAHTASGTEIQVRYAYGRRAQAREHICREWIARLCRARAGLAVSRATQVRLRGLARIVAARESDAATLWAGLVADLGRIGRAGQSFAIHDARIAVVLRALERLRAGVEAARARLHRERRAHGPVRALGVAEPGVVERRGGALGPRARGLHARETPWNAPARSLGDQLELEDARGRVWRWRCGRGPRLVSHARRTGVIARADV